MTERADAIAAKIEAFVRTDVIPYEKDPRLIARPSDELVKEMRAKAKAGVLTPHILTDGYHLTHLETATALQIRPVTIGPGRRQYDGAR